MPEVLHERSNERNIFLNSILSKNIVLNTNKNKYIIICFKYCIIFSYFQYKSSNILILFLVNKGINKKFLLFERSELQAHINRMQNFKLQTAS